MTRDEQRQQIHDDIVKFLRDSGFIYDGMPDDIDLENAGTINSLGYVLLFEGLNRVIGMPLDLRLLDEHDVLSIDVLTDAAMATVNRAAEAEPAGSR